jgi:hypothetical protein
MSPENLTNVYNNNPTLQGQYSLQQYLELFGQGGTTQPDPDPDPDPTPDDPTNKPVQPGIIGADMGRDNDRQGGGGAFGNLDINDIKTFQKDVYNAKTGQFEQQTVTGYKDPAQGNYKTFSGKNINHAGIGFKGIIGELAEMMGFGPEKDEKGFYDGQIAGTFTNFNPTNFKDFSGFLKTKKDRQTFMDNNKKAIDAAERERLRKEVEAINAAASRAESARQYNPAVHGQTNYGLGSDGNQSYSGDAIGASGLGFGTNATTGGPVSNKTGKGRTGYRYGGRTSYFDGGIVSLRRR